MQAQDLSGERSVTLRHPGGEALVIGRVQFTPLGVDRWRFKLVLDHPRFEERFLAMRPFRCVAGPSEQLCHFPYGREDTITRQDLLPLEYALMFLRTKPAALHVEPRNGVFYRLAFSAKGLRGELHDVDVDPIITPKGDGNTRPLAYKHLDRADGASRWLPLLEIE